MKFMRLKLKGTKHCTVVWRARHVVERKLHAVFLFNDWLRQKKNLTTKWTQSVLIDSRIQLLVKTNSLSADDMEASQCISPCGRGGWTLKGAGISRVVELLGFPCTVVSRLTEDSRGKRKCAVCGSCVEGHALLTLGVRGQDGRANWTLSRGNVKSNKHWLQVGSAEYQ